MTGEIYKVKVERTCKNGECFFIWVNKNRNSYFLGRKKSMGKVSLNSNGGFVKSLASFISTFLVGSSGERSSSALIILTSLMTAENSWLEFCMWL